MIATLAWIPGWTELLIIVIFILIFFGSKQIPKIARGIGKGVKEFNAVDDIIKKELKDLPKKIIK